MTDRTDTIAAISTAMNNSGIGIVRISGPEAFAIIEKIFRPHREHKLSEAPSHTVHYGHIIKEGEILDEVLAVLMRGPHTYTREDTIEIDCHGGNYVMNKILELVIASGARIAEPGEFTKRAFLNGRIDLSQAEAVIDVINAENDFALQSAQSQLRGDLSDKIREERAVLLEQLAYLEAALDDPEHIELDHYGETLLEVISAMKVRIEDILSRADDGRIIKEGIRTVILGKPNVGKSSLLNALLGENRAIVTDIAGTTRDVLEETVRIRDVVLNIIDTAGIRDTEDIIEKIGVDKAKEYAAKADLTVFMLDSSRPLDKDDLEISEIIKDKKCICLINKSDLESPETLSEITEKLSCPVISISAKTGSGIDEFTDTVRQMFYNKEINFNDQVYVTNQRQKAALAEALSSLSNVAEGIENDVPEDIYAVDIMGAYRSLGLVIGETVEDDLADEIFAKFCMGK